MRGTLSLSCGLKRRMLIFSLRGAVSFFIVTLLHFCIVSVREVIYSSGTPFQPFIDPFIPAAEALGQEVFVGHQLCLQRETIGAIALLLERFDLGEALGCVGMIDMILRAIAAPAWRQLHLHHVDWFVGERRQGVGFGFPRR